MNERDFKGVWIPKEIWLADDIGWTAKLLLVEIDSLAQQGECFAGNEYFAKFFGLSKDRISKIVKELKNKGYIEVQLVYKNGTKQIEKRVITTRGYRRKQLGGIGENNYTPIGENAEDNNTTIINTINNKRDSKGKAARFTPPAREEVQAYIVENNFNVDAERFIDYYTANGWQVGKNKMKDWRATVRNWHRREQGNKQDKPRVEIWDADSLPF